MTQADSALVKWAGEGYPEALAPVMARLGHSGILSLDVNQGWWPLVRQLDHDIAAITPGYRVERLSEEYGVLDFRIAPEHLSGDVEGLIEAAQAESARTCEICGDRGRPFRQGDWLITLCVDHARTRGAWPARTDADISDAVPRPTDREMAFALSAGVPPSAFTARARHENEKFLQASADADEAVMGSWMSATAVARLIGRTPAEVTHLRKQGALLAGRRRTGRYAFPRWQFDRQNQPLTELQVVLAALRDEDPISVSNVMTASFEALDGLTPAQWLARKRATKAVTQAIDEWRWL